MGLQWSWGCVAPVGHVPTQDFLQGLCTFLFSEFFAQVAAVRCSKLGYLFWLTFTWGLRPLPTAKKLCSWAHPSQKSKFEYAALLIYDLRQGCLQNANLLGTILQKFLLLKFNWIYLYLLCCCNNCNKNSPNIVYHITICEKIAAITNTNWCNSSWRCGSSSELQDAIL